MILQYKGFNNNWCFEEAETITFANVWVGKETQDYREGGCRHKIHLEELQKCTSEEEKNKLQFKYAKEMHDAVDKLITEETHFCDDIVYHIKGKFDKMENVCTVMLADKNRQIVYVFDQDHGVYLLNSRGQTVQRLA